MDEQPFCYKCGEACRTGDTFCRKCNMPLSFQATAGPYETVLAQGYAYHEATERPHKPIILIGMLLMWLPQLALSLGAGCNLLFILVNETATGRMKWGELPDAFALFAFAAGYIFVSWRMVSKTIRNYNRLKHEASEGDTDDPEV